MEGRSRDSKYLMNSWVFVTKNSTKIYDYIKVYWGTLGWRGVFAGDTVLMSMCYVGDNSICMSI